MQQIIECWMPIKVSSLIAQSLDKSWNDFASSNFTSRLFSNSVGKGHIYAVQFTMGQQEPHNIVGLGNTTFWLENTTVGQEILLVVLNNTILGLENAEGKLFPGIRDMKIL